MMEKQGNPPSSPSSHQDHGGGGQEGNCVSRMQQQFNQCFQDECSALIRFVPIMFDSSDLMSAEG